MFVQSLDAAAVLQPMTSKKRATAAMIHADLNERIERLAAREPKFRGCEASLPKPLHAFREGSPNWTIDGFTALQPGCFITLVKIIDQARLEYELVD
jgi:hypothetical protein